MKTTIELSDKVKEFIKTGNADVFTGIYEESYGYLHTCAIHVMKNEDEAQDILQDAGELSQRAEYTDLVTTKFAQKAAS